MRQKRKGSKTNRKRFIRGDAKAKSTFNSNTKKRRGDTRDERP